MRLKLCVLHLDEMIFPMEGLTGLTPNALEGATSENPQMENRACVSSRQVHIFLSA